MLYKTFYSKCEFIIITKKEKMKTSFFLFYKQEEKTINKNKKKYIRK